MIYLTGVTPERKVAGIRALRRVGVLLGAAGGDHALRSLSGAVALWEALRAGERSLLLDDEGLQTAALEAEIAAELQQGGVRWSRDAEEPDGEPEDDGTSYEAVQAAMVLMAVGDGNAGTALTVARTLARVLPDPTWPEVCGFILDTFPPAAEA